MMISVTPVVLSFLWQWRHVTVNFPYYWASSIKWLKSNKYDSMPYMRGRYRLAAASSQWRHNGRDSVSNHQPHDCLLKRFFRRRSKKTSKLRVSCLCVDNSPVTGEFPAQMASNAVNVSIWWRHHVPNDSSLLVDFTYVTLKNPAVKMPVAYASMLAQHGACRGDFYSHGFP